MNVQPDYVSYDAKGRDELLSQIGVVSPAERTLFHRLCEGWEPSIDAQRFLRSVAGSSEQAQSTLERLMARLKGAGLGVLTTRDEADHRVPDCVILTSKGSLEYWIAVLEKEYRQMLGRAYHLLPTRDRLKERNVLPPAYHVAEGDSTALVSAYGDPQTEPRILEYRLLGEFRIIIPTTCIRSLIGAAMHRLRTDLEERGLSDEMARLMNLTIMELKSRVAAKAPDFWLSLTRTMVKERVTIAFRKNLEEQDEIFQTAYLVMSFVDAQIGEARERKEQEHQVDEEILAVAHAVQASGARLFPQEEFLALIDGAVGRLGSTAPAFTRRLTEQLLTPAPRKALPHVVFLAGAYVHRDHVRALFERSRGEVSARVNQELLDLTEAFLRGRLTDIGEVLGSRERLNDDLLERSERLDPVFGATVSRPQLIAEAVIHDARARSESVTPDDLRTLLSRYFDVGNSRLLPMAELLDVSVVATLDAAYSHLNVFRQLLLRMSGRFESMRSTYARRFGRPPGRREGDTASVPPEGGRSTSDSSTDGPGTRSQITGRTDGRQAPAARRRRPVRPTTPARPRPKSRQEVDHVWSEFNKAIHTRRSSGEHTP